MVQMVASLCDNDTQFSRDYRLMPIIHYLSRILFDFGAITSLSDEIKRLRIKRPLLVTDRGLESVGTVDKVVEMAKPYDVTIYSDTTQNPTEYCLERCVTIWHECNCDGIIGLGGGSSIDLAKAVALITSHGGEFVDYDVRTGNSAQIDRVSPHIAIPTGAGTGAEVGRACVMTLNDGTHSIAVNLNMIANTVICDPDLTVTLPAHLTAATGVDALSHGIETFCSTAVNPPADALAIDCLARVSTWLARAVDEGDNRQARYEMMMAALEGGLALQKGLGSAHALASPLGEMNYHHGTLLGILMPHVVDFNSVSVPDKVTRLRHVVGVQESQTLADWITNLVSDIGLPTRLGDLGTTSIDLHTVAKRAYMSHLTHTNPRSVSVEDYQQLLTAAL